MKYSVRGTLHMTDETSIMQTITQYDTRGETKASVYTDENGVDILSFECWVHTEADKDGLFNDLKPFVDSYGERVEWHECTHDEPISKPCKIAETYARG